MRNMHNDLKIAIKFCANHCKRFSAMLRALGISTASWFLPLLRPPWKLMSNFFVNFFCCYDANGIDFNEGLQQRRRA